MWGGGTPAVPATGATAGIPGTWTPPGSTPPASVAALQAGAVVASPATGWTAGQFVQTGTAGAAGRATWTGTGWVGGVAPGTTARSGRRRASSSDEPDAELVADAELEPEPDPATS